MGHIKKSALISYVAIFFNIVSGLLYTPWMIDKLGDSDYGLYTLSIYVISFFLFDFGISSAISRYISKFRAKGDESAVSNFLAIVYKLFLIMSIIVLISIVVFYFFIDVMFLKLTPAELEKFKVVYLITGFFGAAAFPFTSINGVLSGYERFYSLKVGSLIQKMLSVSLMVVLLSMNKGLYAVVIVNSLVGILVIVYKLNILRKLKVKVTWSFFDISMLKELFGFSMWIVIIGIIDQLVVINMPVFILGATVGAQSITMFALSRTIYGYFWMFGDAINGLFIPIVGKISVKPTKFEELNSLIVKVGRIQLIILGLLISGFIVFGYEFVTLWLGKGYEVVYSVTIFLILPFIVLLTQEIAVSHLYMDNKAKYRAYCSIGYCISSLIMCLVLVSKLGIVGIGIGIFIPNIVFNIILLNYFYYSKSDIDIKNFFFNCQAKILPYIALLIGLGVVMNSFFQGEYSWMKFVFKGLTFCIVYAGTFWFFVLNQSEKKQVSDIIKRLK